MIACKKNDVQFTYSPTEPKAGEKVVFSNLSSSGEDWLWTFGDGTTTTIKSPTHIFKKPGTYRVSLKVDNRNAWTATQQITVYDTIPTFVCADTVFSIYTDYTFTAQVYNPYNYEVGYLWSFPLKTPYVQSVDSSLTESSLKLYFTESMEAAPVVLRIVMNGDTTWAERTFAVDERATNSVLFRTSDADYRQRIFNARADECVADASAKGLLDEEQDTTQVYNGHTFTLSEMQSTFPGIVGFHIANRKIYYRADGLWVSNPDGSYPVQIDTAACAAMTLDRLDNRIYWANNNGVWFMPFVGSDNNRFVTRPTLLNTLPDVTKIAADNELK